jgi:tungstate transport system permease protein
VSLLADSFGSALTLLASADATLAEITWLSLRVSATATLLAAALDYRLALGLRLRVGLAAVGDRSAQRCHGPAARRGRTRRVSAAVAQRPLGTLGWLFTPAGMVMAQTVLITPIIAALARQTGEDAHAPLADWFASLGLTTTQRVVTLLHEARFSLAVVLLAGFRTRNRRSRRRDDGRRQHRRQHPRDDNDYRA